MRDRFFGWRRALEAAALLSLTGLVGACDSEPGPAPVELGGAAVEVGALPAAAPFSYRAPPMAAPPVIARAPVAAVPPAAALPPAAAPAIAARPPEGMQVVVRSGQSLGGLAEHYHVAKRDIIAANHLQPPYGIEIGQRLVIPGASGRAEAAAAVAPPEYRTAERATPEVIPLDGPAPAKPAPQPRSAVTQPLDLDAAAPPAGPQAAARTAAAPHGGGLLWPVQGRVLSSFGGTPGGHRNDGINIAAPLGAPIRAADGGVVAYVGNEVRGYGNLVLIRHPDGFISAYAHCQTLLVRKGERVARGQVIAKVGATGGVAQPQLHFELRRGEQAVDPRQFLAPSPAAQGAAARPG